MNQASGIKKLPLEQGKMFYSEAGRRGQLRQVEQEGFVKDKVGAVVCVCVCVCLCLCMFVM